MLAIQLLLASQLVFAATEATVPDVLKGTIVDKGERRPLYNYIRTAIRENEKTTVKREYFTTSGDLAASEKVVYQGGKVIRMELEHRQTGETGFFEIQDQKVHFQYSKGSKTKSDDEKLEGNFVSSDEIVPFLQRNWEALEKGETLSIRFPVITRAETVGFKFFKETEREGNMIIKMKPTSFVIAALVDPLFFKMKKEAPHRLLEVDGRVTPKKKVGDDWKDLDAILVIE